MLQRAGALTLLLVGAYASAAEPRTVLERLEADGVWREVSASSDAAATVARLDPTHDYRVTAINAVGNTASAPVLRAPIVCRWRGAVITSEMPCLCAVAVERLNAARALILDLGIADQVRLDALLDGLAISLVRTEHLRTDKLPFQVAAGMAGGRQVYLATDMHAAAHELLHIYHHATGVDAGADGHEPWRHDARLRELDRRSGLPGTYQ